MEENQWFGQVEEGQQRVSSCFQREIREINRLISMRN